MSEAKTYSPNDGYLGLYFHPSMSRVPEIAAMVEAGNARYTEPMDPRKDTADSMAEYMTCHRKRRFERKRQANSRIKVAGRKGVKLYSYECRFCRGFHLSKNVPKLPDNTTEHTLTLPALTL